MPRITQQTPEFRAPVGDGRAFVACALGDEWEVRYYLASIDGRPEVAGLEIRRQGGGPTLARGLSARDLRALRPGAALAEARRTALLMRHEERRAPERARATFEEKLVGIRTDALATPARRGRPRLPDRFYAQVAAAYVARVDAGSRRPIADAAADLNYSPGYIRGVVSKARDRGLLTPAVQGRIGGELTPAGLTAIQPPQTN